MASGSCHAYANQPSHFHVNLDTIQGQRDAARLRGSSEFLTGTSLPASPGGRTTLHDDMFYLIILTCIHTQTRTCIHAFVVSARRRSGRCTTIPLT